ncbi:MAG: c-type cytochrome [Deltaproteobacteria bacterium]|nr:c-type cytochrome [Deltaproteobacteria bacterium]
MNKILIILIAFLIFTTGFGYPLGAADDGKGFSLLNTPDGIIRGQAGRDMYMKHCASCHHAERYGLKAPALMPETLKTYKNEELAKIIKDGLPSTQMPPFKEVLSDGDIDKIISHIILPLNNARWTKEDIVKSREVFTEPVIQKPISNLDYENITLVVESSRSITVMDGNNFKSLDKFQTGAIHGGPKFSYSLRYIYAPTRDGVITKYDIYTLKKIGSVKAGINMRNIAISHDDKWVAAANYLPGNIVFLNDELTPTYVLETSGKIGGIYTLISEKKFVCAFRDMPNLWLINYTKGFEIESLALPEPFEDISISPFEDIIIGSSRKGTRIYIYSLKQRKVINNFETDGMPHLASATYWVDKGVLYTAINHLKRPVVTILDLNNRKVVKEINLNGAGFFVRTHQNTPFIWVDTNTDAIQIIDKAALQVVKTLIPSKDKKAMHIEFTKDGRYAMASIYEEEGALVIYDAFKLTEIMRIPLRKPAGKYNALNKTYPKIQALAGHPSEGWVGQGAMGK